jgi:hypothetical protein
MIDTSLNIVVIVEPSNFQCCTNQETHTKLIQTTNILLLSGIHRQFI